MFLIRKFIVKRAKPIGRDYKYKWKKKMAISVCGINYGFVTNKWMRRALGRYRGNKKRAVVILSKADENNKIYTLYALETKYILLELIQGSDHVDLWKLYGEWSTIKIEQPKI